MLEHSFALKCNKITAKPCYNDRFANIIFFVPYHTNIFGFYDVIHSIFNDHSNQVLVLLISSFLCWIPIFFSFNGAFIITNQTTMATGKKARQKLLFQFEELDFNMHSWGAKSILPIINELFHWVKYLAVMNTWN